MIIVFWDYDGTLVDTEIIYKDSLISFFDKNNYTLKKLDNYYFFKNISGRHPEEFLQNLKEDGYIKQDVNIDPIKVKEYYTEYFKKLDVGEIKITNNIDTVIKKLMNNKDVIMCITSSSYNHDFLIKHSNITNKTLKEYFKIGKNVYLCGEIKNCNFKPSPDIFEYAFNDIIKKYNLNISKNDNLFIIEDSTAGCKAGYKFKNIFKNKINITIIGYDIIQVLDNSDKLLQSGADVVAKNSSDLLRYIK